MTTTERRLAEPLRSVTDGFGLVILAFVAFGVLDTIFGTGSWFGFGHAPGLVCVNQPRTTYNGDNWTALGVSARSGAYISINGTLQACAVNPGIYQRLLFTMTELPSTVLWGGVLFILWRLVRTASVSGPFTLPVAASMRRLAWIIMIGSLAVASAQGAALDALLTTLLRAQNDFGDAVPVITQVLPVPLLIGAALLTFARIIRHGAAMDEELQATV